MSTPTSKPAQERNKLVICGYIRNIMNLYKDLNIPIEINDIIHLYYRVYDAWNQKYAINKSEYILIDTINPTVTFKHNSGVTIYGEQVIKSGVFKWRVRMISFGGRDGYSFPHIGIVENDETSLMDYVDNVNFDDFGHLLCSGFGAIYSFSKNLPAKAKFVWNKAGDIMEVKLDLNNGKLYFTMNESDSDQLCIDIESSPKGYRFALAVCSKAQFEFIM